jgi:[CysO sulfur-carrier protein]-S-L-cysteine hydrolase
MTEQIKLPRFLVNQLLAHAQRHSGYEVCGLIGARAGAPVACYPVTNIAEHPERLYAMDPTQQIDALRKMRERNQELYAIYHSHPRSPAVPSATDLAQASYPGILYLIISLETKGTLQMRGFRFDNGGMQEVVLEITR